jgi:hypothetical protein
VFAEPFRRACVCQKSLFHAAASRYDVILTLFVAIEKREEIVPSGSEYLPDGLVLESLKNGLRQGVSGVVIADAEEVRLHEVEKRPNVCTTQLAVAPFLTSEIAEVRAGTGPALAHPFLMFLEDIQVQRYIRWLPLLSPRRVSELRDLFERVVEFLREILMGKMGPQVIAPIPESDTGRLLLPSGLLPSMRLALTCA